MGQYFEDLNPGDAFTTPARTVTEADVVQFAGLSGDYNPIHTDYEFCRETPFGRPIAHGLLTLSILTGLLERTGVQEGTIVALRRVLDLEFRKAVFPGDTIHGELEVLEKELREKEPREGSGREGSGRVRFRMRGVNQRGETVVDLRYDVLLRRRAEA